MSKVTKTPKQLTAAKKRRSTTLKKLDKIYKKSLSLSDNLEKIRLNWVECVEKVYPLELRVTKKEYKKAEAPCNKMQKQMRKIEKEKQKLSDKANTLEESVGQIEAMYNIPMNEPY
jgi:chromosome segregation ATPase